MEASALTFEQFRSTRRRFDSAHSLQPSVFSEEIDSGGYMYDGGLIILDCPDLWRGLRRYHLSIYSLSTTSPDLHELELELYRLRSSSHFGTEQHQFFEPFLSLWGPRSAEESLSDGAMLSLQINA